MTCQWMVILSVCSGKVDSKQLLSVCNQNVVCDLILAYGSFCVVGRLLAPCQWLVDLFVCSGKVVDNLSMVCGLPVFTRVFSAY